MKLDDVWIAAELAICEGATEGPYQAIETFPGTYRVIKPTERGAYVAVCELPYDYYPREVNKGNAAFFASVRTGYPAALKALQEAREAVDSLRELFAALDEWHPDWRKNTLGVGENGDRVNAAWDQCAAALAKPDAMKEAQG